MNSQLTKKRLLSPADIKPTNDVFEVIGVFNPGVIYIDDDVLMLARIAERPLEDRRGFTGLPRWTSGGDSTVDWVANAELQSIDSRVVKTKVDGCLRLTSVSYLQVFRRKRGSADPWSLGSRFLPNSPLESFGIEDARITQIDQTYWITYVAVSPTGVATVLASSDDMLTLERHGIIFPPENKDVVLFPSKINGQYYALHRPNPSSRFSPPQIWLARSDDLIHWGDHAPLVAGCHCWEGDRIGAGTPPILIDEGWLLAYHGCSRPASETAAGQVGVYSAGLLLLDRDDPSRVLTRSSAPLLFPTTSYETTGFVPDVVFPTAMIDAGESIDLYYGAADTSIAFVTMKKQALLDSLHWN
ncbi:glycoside hydrolase family 130 protein [Novipirellula artificiosorum]|uniref:Beta-1,4-mannooligosaccharide phosphorylase n=1 Tax=Novipirellula artificiosorum TaxID=2528016 RepID=A0A5C6D3R3_9BACT|nr:glycoside hydrolase family 130 protein [Novipirellula artificiosorum]TWU31388.1 Beta-1,4-mannooligosaccharide phosphorylase [Novipirellula artificiosorum]